MPVLLHAITLPCGADVFWQIVGTEFQSDDWKVRFTAGQYRRAAGPLGKRECSGNFVGFS